MMGGPSWCCDPALEPGEMLLVPSWDPKEKGDHIEASVLSIWKLRFRHAALGDVTMVLMPKRRSR